MKQLLLFICLFFAAVCTAQDYEAQWDNVIKLESQGLVRSAADAVNSIYLQAKKDHNEPQIIKTFFFRAKYMQVLEEGSQAKVIIALQEDKKAMGIAAAAIMESIYADILDNIYDSNRYNISQRAHIKGPLPEDFTTWSRENYTDEITSSYKKSITARETLYRTPLEEYDAIVELNPVMQKTGRTLYDFLAERYLAYLNETFHYPYTLNEQRKALFMDTPAFLALSFPDSLSFSARPVIELYQEIEQFYSAKKDTVALQRAIIRRLGYFDGRFYEKPLKEIYLATVSGYSESWHGSPYIYNAMYARAGLYTNLADKEKHPDYLAYAVQLCDAIIDNAKHTDCGPAAQSLKNTIVNRESTLSTRQYVVPGRPLLASVAYKNIDTLRVRIFRVPERVIKATDEWNKVVAEGEPVHDTLYVMPKTSGYFRYTTEVVLPALEKGKYIVAALPAGENPDNMHGLFFILASQIAVIDENVNYIDKMTYRVVDRQSGKPLNNVKVASPQFKGKTNGQGIYSIESIKAEKNENVALSFIYEGDTLSVHKHVYNYARDYKDDAKDIDVFSHIYLDRAIYRPGQTVYFKGILIQRIDETQSLVGEDIFVNVLLEGPSGEELGEKRVPVNQFGSFTGEFLLPANGQTGEYTISVEEDMDYKEDEHPFWDNKNLYFEENDIDFKVEEYKRPTFETTFEDVKDEVFLNKTITAKGKARNFSGAPVSGAKVAYNVRRTAIITNYDYRNPVYSDSKIVASGEVVTDAEGVFAITFTAEADSEISPESRPVFNYTVTADVTDISGETHTGTQTIKAGYHSLELEAEVPMSIRPSGKSAFALYSKNLNGKFVPVKGHVKIYRLAVAEHSYLPRPWNSPEIQTIPKELFKKLFPHIPYESSAPSGIREEVVFTAEIDTEINKEIIFENFTGWEQGRYELLFTAGDAGGNTIEAKEEFSILPPMGVPQNNKPFDYELVNSDYTKDGYARIMLLTPLPQLYVSVYAEGTDGTRFEKLVKLGPEGKIIRIPFKAGAMAISFSYLWENEFCYKNFNIEKSSDSQLEIEASSITNKFMPGSEQTWSFTIKGSEKEQAEVLASMYDKSLDDFATTHWERLYRERRHIYAPRKSLLHVGESYGSFDNSYGHSIRRPRSDLMRTFGFDINNTKFVASAEVRERISDTAILQNGGLIINGVVSDATGPLPGASVIVEGTRRSATTDIDGKYSISVIPGETLQASYVGYQTKTMAIGSQKSVDFMLTEGTILEEVVMDVYRSGSADEMEIVYETKHATLAATTISVEVIQDRANASVLQSLQGQVAGLNIATGSGAPGAESTIILRGVGSIDGNVQPLFVVDGIPVDEDGFRSINANDLASFTILKDSAAIAIYGSRGANGVVMITTKKGLQEEKEALEKVKTRKNFNETAFFYPQLHTDKDGNVSFTFTAPEALTEWKLRLFAHNKKAESGYFAHTAITQKDLMIVPNMPRFLREKDTIVIVAKITNLTLQDMTGNAMLQLFDAATMQPVDAQMLNSESMKPFTIAAKGNTTASWTITVPQGLQGVQYRVAAKTGNFTDGEESILPVLTNSMLVTESIPLWVKPNTTKEYTLENLKNNNSSTLRHQGITLEYTSNPTWLALQSLPYLMEFEHECAEQVFSRYYANAIATHVLDSNPKVAEVIASWRAEGKQISKLAQNEELKSIIMAESPWLLDTESEEEKKNRLALLFDLDKMKMGLAVNLGKLEDKQSASGGFPWFEGGRDNEYITRHILAGFAHLKKLGVAPGDKYILDNITGNGIAFIDAKFMDNYRNMEAAAKAGNKHTIIPHAAPGLHYLYTRSFYHEQYKPDDSLNIAIKKYLAEIKHDWLDYPLYEKGMAALTLHRFGDTITSGKIMRSLKETSSNNEEWGMYWKNNTAGWHWYKAPIETQALLIEAFAEAGKDTVAVDAMKVWLIKQKQNKHWPTTKSTTEAVYALIMQGTNWLSVKDATAITYGNPIAVENKLAQTGREAETGYLKMQWKPEEVTKDLATLTIENKSSVPGYGGLYWQYFEELDKISSAQKGLMNVDKELYVKSTGTNGTELKKIIPNSPLKIGELVTVRLVLNIKEDVEYVHLKDLRAAAFEPVNVLSGYEYRNGLGYYHSTRDAATHFFFDFIKRGTYVLEYDIRVNNAGAFSNGITTIQSMYAPEFSGHTKGIRVTTE